MIGETPLTIGELAPATRTQTETIRYYERMALLPAPTRTAPRYGIYGRGDVTRRAFVKRSRDLGFTSRKCAFSWLSRGTSGEIARRSTPLPATIWQMSRARSATFSGSPR